MKLNSFEEEDLDQTSTNEHQERKIYGKLIIFGKDERGYPRYMLGPHWPLFLTAFLVCLFLIALLVYGSFERFNLFWKIVVSLSATSFLGSYLYVAFSDPGVVLPTGQLSPLQRQNHRFCDVCQLVRPRKAEHCQECEVCIQGLDHHCPWVGKCIGRKNLYAFYAFLILTFLNMFICFAATATANISKVTTK